MSLELQRYLDRNSGFSFAFPSAWADTLRIVEQQAAVVVGPAGTDGFRRNLVATLTEGVTGLEEWVDQEVRSMDNDLPLFRLLDRRVVANAPAPSALLTYLGMGPRYESVTQLAVYMAGPQEQGFTVTATCHSFDFDACYDELYTCLSATLPPQAGKGN